MISKSPWAKLKRGSRRQLRRAKILGNNPMYVPVITGFCLILATCVLLVIFGNAKQIQVTPDSKIVIISHDGIKQVVPSNDKTVGSLLSRLDIQIHSGDVVQPNLNTPINQDDFRVNIYRAKPVEIIQNGSPDYTFSAAATPRAIAEQAGTGVSATDYITSSPSESFLANGSIGQQVVVDSGIQINLNLYGLSLPIFVHASTVADLITAENIHLSPTDQLSPSLNSPIHPNQTVTITGKGVTAQIVKQAIPMPTQIIEDSSLSYGVSSVVQQGSPGEEDVVYEEIVKNGVTTSVPIETINAIPAVTDIVDEGDSLSGIQGDMSLAGISPGDFTYVDYIVSHESGWCPTKAQGEHYCPASPDNAYTPDGYGLCQATPGYKMSSSGSDWATNPITQLKWCNGYAVTRYGSWSNAYVHWINNGNW